MVSFNSTLKDLLELCEPIENPGLFLSDEDECGLKDDTIHNKAEDSESEPEMKASKGKQRTENMGKSSANAKVFFEEISNYYPAAFLY